MDIRCLAFVEVLMFFRKTNVRCVDCRRFVPGNDDARRGTCHLIEVDDATTSRDCRWYEPRQGEARGAEGVERKEAGRARPEP